MEKKNDIPVTQSSMPPFEEYVKLIEKLWDTHWLTNMGEYHKKLEIELLQFLDIKNISLFVNGHSALEMIIQAFNFPEGSEVITSPFTFASTTHAIVRNGLIPVFCDINPADCTIDVEKIEKLITNNTVAILPIHVYGNIANVEEIDRIAKKYDLKVIYDAAHAFGETYKGVGVGNFGDASMFSFHATKVFNSIEGGAVCYKEERLGQKLYMLKNFGIQDAEHVVDIGANAKMNEFQAAMGLCNLKYVRKNIEARKKVHDFYVAELEHIRGIEFIKSKEEVESNYSYFPIFINEKEFGMTRNQVHEIFKENGIITRKYFYPITNEFECYKKNKAIKLETTPIAKEMSERVLTIPMYADLQISDLKRVCDVLKECRIR